MDLRESQFERATELFYEAAAVPELWPSALQMLAESCSAAGTILFPVGSGDGVVSSSGIKDFTDALVSQGWAAKNPHMRRGMELTAAGWRGLITQEDMLTPDELAQDPYINEFTKPHGIGSIAGMVLVKSDPNLVLPISIERRRRDGPYARDEVRQMNRLMGQVQSAAILALKVGFSAASGFANGLGAVGKDVALIGGSGRLFPPSEGFLRHVGDAFNLRNGLLSSWEPNTNRQLADAIRRAVSNAPVGERAVKAIALLRRSGRRPLIAQIVPITRAAHDIFMLARAVMILTDPDATSTARIVDESLSALGLSPAETRLARRIGVGEELNDAAESEHITLETARSRLKAIFVKTGTHRQTQLALLVAALSI